MPANRKDEAKDGDDFPSRFRACLVDSGVSQAHLARELGVSRTAVQYWKTGEHRPNQRHLAGIARVLGTSLERLLGPRDSASAISKKVDATALEERLEELDLAGALIALRRAQPEIERLAASLPSLMDLLREAERRAG